MNENTPIEQPKKKSVLKKVLKILGIIAVAVLGVFGIYHLGKFCGAKELLSSDGIQGIRDDAADDAIDDYRRRLVQYVSTGDFASKFTDENGVAKYMTYAITEEKPDWWDLEDSRHFDMAEEVLKF